MADDADKDNAEAAGIEAGSEGGSDSSMFDDKDEAAARKKGYETGKALSSDDDDE